ncbi:MAG: xanthine dehydrogenase family protein molybdopterin-binding subunit [Acidimicrobiales bacterium]
MTIYVGEPLKRREDHGLLVGAAPFMADIARPGTLHVSFVRSSVAHADITAVAVDDARAMPGIVAVLSAADFGDQVPQPSTHELGTRPTPYFALAKDTVRYVGEAIVAVVGESPTCVADALELVEIDYRDRPVVVDVTNALEAESPLVYPDWSDNVAGTFAAEIGDIDSSIEQADVVVTRRLRIQRQTATSLEGRGAMADWDPHAKELLLWTSTQSPHIVRDFLAEVTGLPTHKIVVRVPSVGGAFGAKFHYYPEESAVALLSMMLKRPVIWLEGRSESFLATVHARQQTIDATIAATADGKIVGISADLLADIGAYLHMASYGPAWLTAVMMTGVYEIPNARARLKAVVTNKTPSGSYRGWGQPQANFVVERMVDLLANELSIDPIELRRRNFIAPEKFPYTSLFHTYDNGEYELCLDQGLEAGQYEQWRVKQAAAKVEGRHVGIGLSFYVENTALGPSRQMNQGGLNQGGYDISNIRMEPGGEVTLYTGLCEMGQGFTNGLAQMAAETIGLHIDQVTVVTGDTDKCPYTGHGTGASRSAAVGGAAVRKASLALRERVTKIAAHMLEAAEQDLVIEDGNIWVDGSPARSITTADVGRAAYLRAIDLPPDVDPGLEVIEVFDPTAMAWPYGLNVAVVEVDIETGLVKVIDYTVFHDCGTILNPMIVDGQIHGGVAQGIAAALFEELPYDEDGQPLAASLMSYLVPSSMELPNYNTGHIINPSPVIPGGMKGVGEAGVIGPPAAIVNAIEDALRDYGVSFTETPVTPQKIFEALSAKS